MRGIEKRVGGKKKEEGFVLVIALIVLLVATVAGIFAIQNTTIDTKISGNERIATLLFNAADAGGDAGVSWFKVNTSDGGTKPTTSSSVPPLGGYFSTDLTLGTDMQYNFRIDARVKSTHPPAGWDPTLFRQYYYLITSQGKANGAKGAKNIEIEVSRVFRK